jgi:tol-pal system protein YbgF
MVLCSIPVRLGVGLPLAIVAAVAFGRPACSQDDASTQERLDRIERDLNMLQRQVYRGGGGAAERDTPGPVDTELRLQRIETKMRELTGQVEDAANQMHQLRQRIEQINSDIEVRMGQGAGPAAVAAARPGRPVAAAEPPLTPSAGERGGMTLRGGDSLTPPASLTPPGRAVPPPNPGPRVGELTPPGPTPLLPGNAANGGNGGALPSGSAAVQYNYAFGLLKQADYSNAENALRAFVHQHPGSALAGNAEYWLGETYYARGRYADAAVIFAEGYKNYPKGAKAADDLLKLGMSLARANQAHNACIALNQLDHDFPHAGQAVKSRAVAERKRLGC